MTPNFEIGKAYMLLNSSSKSVEHSNLIYCGAAWENEENTMLYFTDKENKEHSFDVQLFEGYYRVIKIIASQPEKDNLVNDDYDLTLRIYEPSMISFLKVIRVQSIQDPEITFDLEPLRTYDSSCGYYKIIELRHTKFNLINVDGQVCKARSLNIFPSGKVRLWFSYPKGKSFSQGCYAILVKII